MKDQRVKLGKKGFQQKQGWINGFIKPTGKVWKIYFAKKKRKLPLDQQITDDNWWEWC